MNFIRVEIDDIRKGDYYRWIPKESVGSAEAARKTAKRAIVLEVHYNPETDVKMVLLQRVSDRLVRDTSQVPYWAVTKGVFPGQITFWRGLPDGNNTSY